jgi:UDP-glucose:(heptosyl)LPS alpha-1,3-glucosyltransferase
MKLAFVKQKQVPFGGGEGYVCRLMKGCAQHGHEVHLITASWPESDFDFPVTVHTVPINGCSRRTKLFSFAQSVRQCVEAGAFDCVFSMERTESQHIWRAGEGVHKVWLEHRAEFEPCWKTWFNTHSSGHRAYLEMEKRCVRSTPHIIANSAMVKGYIEQVYPGLSAEIHVIHNGCDLSFFSPENRTESRQEIVSRHGLDAAAPLILFPGSDWVRKGLKQAFLVLAHVPDARLIVAGRGNPSPWMKLARKLGVADRVIFAPPTQGLRAYYRAADISLLPTWSDPFANVSLETIACGTPLVTTAYNGGCEIVKQGENGFTVKNPADVEAMADGLKTQLTRRHESGRARAVSASVEDCTLERNWVETLAVIQKAAGR